MEDIIKSYSLLEGLNVSRETYLDFEILISMIQEKNQEINIVSKETAKNTVIRERHIIDSAQIIDFIDLNSSTSIDLGTGGGMPGIVMAIMIKNLKKDLKINLYEKSHRKSFFLREVSRKLKLQTEVFEQNIFESKEIETGTIMARAFKPIPVILDLVHQNFKSYKNLILFMGKNGKKILEDTLRDWDLEYTEKKSLTNEESFLLNIKNIKKK
jgi:16S rRNA (guanine527-N7)-methyltransferase